MRVPKILVLNRTETFADQVRGVCDGLDPRPEVFTCERVGSVGDVIARKGPFDVLVAGPSLASRSGLARVEAVHDAHPQMSVLLAFARRPEASLRDIVRTGALDLLQLPIDDGQLTESIERALEVAGQHSAVVAAPVDHAANGSGGPGRVFTITSATGGCGKTFFSSNLAYFLSKHGGGRVCVIDLDLQFGEMATALRLRPRYTIFDALEQDDADEADLQAQIEEFLVPHDTGVWLLAAPKSPEEADRIDPPDVTRIIEAVRSHFDFVVVDTPTALTEIVLAALDLSDTLYVLGTLDLPSIRNMSVFLGTLEKLKIPADNVRLIMNKAESDVGLDLDQVKKLFPREFDSILPYAKEVSRSMNLGIPVLAAAPQAEVSAKLARGLTRVLPPDRQVLVPEPASGTANGLLRRIFARA